MLEIEYKGGNTVTIGTKQATIIVDPKASLVGLKDISTKGQIELATEDRFALNNADATLNIEGPGEYGIAKFDIRGIAAQRHLDTENQPLISTMYRIEVNDVRIGVIGNIYEKLQDDQLEELGVIDILILPVGGNGYTLDATAAAGLTRQISPKVVIPVHYADANLKYEVPQDDVEVFVKELGATVEESSKLKIKQASQLPAGLTIVKLDRTA
ncbi:Zn-dependent hydrolase [Candidatus Saccharibacteria bacterium 32-49-12]|nr:MAG: Zn-dependent hydrolase [Candidatus Saccharibacteria bacterium 32-49-12]